jgi:transcriptional regulator with XRE-family HTH domain
MEQRVLRRSGHPLTTTEVAGLQVLGGQLRRARFGMGWSQMHLEQVSGVDQTTISRLENGRLAHFSLVRLGRLALALEGIWPFDVVDRR